MILDLNLYLTTSIYSESFSDLLTVGTAFSSIVFATIISFNFLLASSLTFFTLLVRYLMLPFLLLAFPVSIFLYFLPFTKEWGAFMVKFSLAIIFMTTIDAIVVLGMSYLFEAGDPLIADGFVNGIALMLGFGLIGLINLIIYAIAVLSLVMAAVKVFESVISIGWKIAMLAALL
jgi:hypothetical protein